MSKLSSRSRHRVPKRRLPPARLADCRCGDLIVLHVRVTSSIGGQPFGRVAAGDRESTLFGLPLDGVIQDVLEVAP